MTKVKIRSLGFRGISVTLDPIVELKIIKQPSSSLIQNQKICRMKHFIFLVRGPQKKERTFFIYKGKGKSRKDVKGRTGLVTSPIKMWLRFLWLICRRHINISFSTHYMSKNLLKKFSAVSSCIVGVFYFASQDNHVSRSERKPPLPYPYVQSCVDGSLSYCRKDASIYPFQINHLSV